LVAPSQNEGIVTPPAGCIPAPFFQPVMSKKHVSARAWPGNITQEPAGFSRVRGVRTPAGSGGMGETMNRVRELEILKRRAGKVEGRLRELNRRLARMEQRDAGPHFRAVVRADRCKGCGTCEAVCPTGAVRVDNTARIDENRCVGCGRCADACPAAAIVLQRMWPEGAKQIRGIS